MRSASKAFRQKLLDDKRNYKIKLVTTLANNTVLDDIIEKNIWGSSFKFSDATSGTTSFDLGSAIINKLNFALNNMYNKYSAYDFNGATVICHVGLTLDDGTTEYLKIGHFTVYEQPTYNGSLISFICYDNMYKFDKKITGMTGTTMGQVAVNICSAIGVSINTPQFNGYNLAITLPTNITSMTYRQLLSYVAQLTGNFARINSDGLLEIKWYDTDFYSSEINLDGGTFKTTTTPYSDGDNANGGDFTFSETTDYDGGTFTDLATFHHIYSLNSQSFSTDDVIITGVKLTDSSQKAYITGTTEYALSIENNPLVTPTNAQTYLNFLGTKLIGMRFRKFSVSALSDPTIECGDNAKISDNKGHTYYSFVNSNTFNIGNFQPIACNCASPLQNSSEKNSATTQNLVNARKEAENQISAYDLLVKQMTDLIANGFGVFKTEVIDENGGKIYYTHDKKLMSDSSVRWFQTSTGQIEQNKINGVWTTVSAQDSSGNALVKVLTAIGINAEWIKVLTSFNVNDKFIVDSTGKCIADTFESKNANITGGSINIESSDKTYSAITLKSGDFDTSLHPEGVYLNDRELNTSMIVGARGIYMNGNSGAIIDSLTNSVWANSVRANEDSFFYKSVWVDGTLHLASEPAISSDEHCKNSILDLDIETSAKFIYALQPKKFKYDNGTSDRFHHGLIAQQTKSVMKEDSGLYVEEKIIDEETQEEKIKCGLRYGELIADLIATVQSQNKRLEVQEKRITELENKLLTLN